MNTIAYFEIQADDLPETARFYNAVFGWKFTHQPGLPVDYYRIDTGKTRGGLLKRPAPVPHGGAGTNAFTCSMEVADFDSAAEKILAQGGTVALPKFAIPGVCYQGYFLDPAGNTFGLFQPDPEAR